MNMYPRARRKGLMVRSDRESLIIDFHHTSTSFIHPAWHYQCHYIYSLHSYFCQMLSQASFIFVGRASWGLGLIRCWTGSQISKPQEIYILPCWDVVNYLGVFLSQSSWPSSFSQMTLDLCLITPFQSWHVQSACCIPLYLVLPLCSSSLQIKILFAHISLHQERYFGTVSLLCLGPRIISQLEMGSWLVNKRGFLLFFPY